MHKLIKIDKFAQIKITNPNINLKTYINCRFKIEVQNLHLFKYNFLLTLKKNAGFAMWSEVRNLQRDKSQI